MRVKSIPTLAPGPDKGYGHVRPSGAGHFVKMVHNGIEYGPMKAYAAGFELMQAKGESSASNWPRSPGRGATAALCAPGSGYSAPMRIGMVELHVLDDKEKAAQAAAELVASLAEESVTSQGHFAIALSGGSTPRLLYQILASHAYRECIMWNNWHVFWGDERCVPPDHVDSNYRTAREALLDQVPIPSARIHRMRGEIAPQKAAEEYEAVVREASQTPTPSFDLILLGMGEDGHTASLFPGTQALQEVRRLVVANWAPRLQAYRITFTLPLINAARAVVFLVADESKAEVLRRVLEPKPDEPALPTALVRPTSGALHWFLTRAAASRLKEVHI